MLRTLIAAAAAVSASAANSWSTIASGVGTASTGITFNADGKTGWLADLSNGVGANIMKSTDGGNTWTSTTDAFELMVLDVTSSGNSVASMGALSAEYSSDGGNTFNTSVVNSPGMGAGQCIRNLGPHDSPIGFAMVGQFGLFTMDDGVAISTDFGATYTPINITNLYTDARYGAFPTATNWYVSAGEWPGEGTNDQTTSTGSGSTSSSPTSSSPTSAVKRTRGRALTGRISIQETEAGLRYSFSRPTESHVAANRKLQAPPTGQYVAQIVQSNDGGKTWNSTFYRENWAYLNGIDCLDQNRCCVTAENDDQNGFAAILCTQNAGISWTQTYFNNATGASLLDLRVVGTNGYWAVGGIASSAGSAAGFLYSGDAGNTWTLDTVISGVFASSVDCAVGTQECWATLLDVDTQQASIGYASTV